MKGLLQYGVLVCTSYVAVYVLMVLGNRRKLVDLPNARSSHKVAVPRLGGAGFIPVILIAGSWLWRPEPTMQVAEYAFLAGALALFAMGLIDDVVSLWMSARLLIQLITVAIVVYFIVGAQTGVLGTPLGVIIWLSFTVGIVGVVNIYNFMDGIDGIAGVQGLSAALGWWALSKFNGSEVGAVWGLTISSGLLGFLILNWSPARIFMGDSGSTVMGYILGFIPLLVWREVGPEDSRLLWPGCAVLLLWPFLFDGIFTLTRRAIRRENILKAHRSHLYQRLVIAGRSHRSVSTVYGILALVGVVLVMLTATSNSTNLLLTAPAIGVMALLLWGWTVRCERKLTT